jgi:predicted ATPase/DNA-binding SARP family transcriptional activator
VAGRVLAGRLRVERVRLHMLGAERVERGGKPVSGFESRKALALLCYLALQSQPRPRAQLAELFWPDRTEARSRGNLNRVLHNLTHLVPGCLDVNRQSVGIAFGAVIWIDVVEFDQLATQGDLASLSAAADLYAGDLLAGIALDDCPEFDQWLAATREHWRQRAIHVLHRLVEHHSHAGAYAAGIAHAERLLAIDPWQEEAHRAMMRLLAASGQRNAALAQYEACRRRLADDLGIEPESATIALYEQLRDGVELEALAVGQPLAPLPARPAAPSQRLPRPTTSFIGRERELEQIVERLHDPECRLLTLLGLGGIGKTRLALRAAEALAPHFADGVAFVALEPDSSEGFLLAAVADACNFVFTRGADPAQLLANYLRRREILLLLDNGEYLGTGARALAALLEQAPGVKVLAASRERLQMQGEWLLEIEGLEYSGAVDDPAGTLSSAIQLFRQRVAHARPGRPLAPQEYADAARICQLVAGSPLAIELAASWTRVLSCREIANEVARDLNFLTTSLKDVPERHRSLRAVFDHSWRLLVETERAVCRRLSVFRGGFDRIAAERVADATPGVLAALVDKLFVYRGAVKQYALHELVRQYTQAKLAEDPDEYDQTQRRHFGHYAALIQERAPALASAGQPDAKQAALAEINAEIENIRAGWSWAASQQAVEMVEPFVEGLALFYNHQGWFAEIVSLLEEALRLHRRQALEAAGERAGRLRQARWERQIGVALYALGRIEESQRHLHRALELLGQPAPAAPGQWAIGLLGQILQQTLHRLWPGGAIGRAPPELRDAYIEAARVYERLTEVYYFNDQTLQIAYTALKALNLSEAYGISQELVQTYANACIAAGAIPFVALADAYSRRAEQVARQVQYQPAHAYSLLCTGAYAAGLARWEQARAALEESMAVAAACGDQRVWEESLTNLVMVAYYEGDLPRHLALCRELEASADQRGDAQVQSWARVEQSMNCLLLGPVETAPALLEEALALVAGNIGRAEEILARGLLALVYLRNADRQRALAAADRVAQLTARAWPTTYFAIHGYAGVAEVYAMLWETAGADARAMVRAADRACRDLRRCARVFPIARPYAALWDGLRAALSGSADGANALWLAGLADAERLRMPYLEGLLHERLARALGPRDRARVDHAEQARVCFARLGARYDLARLGGLIDEM